MVVLPRNWYCAARKHGTVLAVVGMLTARTAAPRTAAAAAATAAAAAGIPPVSPAAAVPVFFDNDGGNDDIVALVYLLKHCERFNLLGVTVTPADSWWDVGTLTVRKVLRALSSKDAHEAPTPVAEATLEGVHAFPDAWRLQASSINLLPQLNNFETEEDAKRFEEGEGDGSNKSVTGQLLLAQTLLAADSPVTVVATGPLTALAWVLDSFPEVSSKIEKVLIMGGAIDVSGNVSEDGFDGSAEWNFFWDPPAAKRVWDSDLKLVLTPLDATNELPVTKDMIKRLGRQHESASSFLVATIWSLAGASLLETKKPFYVWDLLTVVQLVHPELFTTTEVECDVVVDGASQGRIVRTGQSDASDAGQGRSVTVIHPRDANDLFDVIVNDLGSP